MDTIRYIIKFFDKAEYAKTFLDEQAFYANPVGYYINLEKGQGDCKEASIIDRPLNKTCKNIQVMDMKAGAGIPVFCCYAVTENDIDGTRIVNINKKCIEDFNKKREGVAVVIPFDEFIKAVNSCSAVIKKGMVQYTKKITIDDTIAYSMSPLLAIYRKSNVFDYQNEYRIAFKDFVNGTIKKNGIGFFMDFDGLGKKYFYKKKVNLVGNYGIDSFIEDNNGYCFLNTGIQL